MRVNHLLAAAVVVISSAALVVPTDAAQRQRNPGGAARSGGGGGNQGGGNQGGANQGSGNQGGGAAPRQNGGGGERRAAAPRNNDNGGGRRDNGGGQAAARPPQATAGQGQGQGQRQQANGGQQAVAPRYAQPRRYPDATTDVRRGTSERFDQGRVGEQPRVAVPRATVTNPRYNNGNGNGNWNRNGYRVYTPYYGTYNRHYGYPYYGHAKPYYYYPYSFGYGPYGRGSFYFDLYYNSYVFYPPAVARYDNYGSYYGTYGYPTGELRLRVRPREAQVFINGAYAGTVDEFDGNFQSLRLEGGDYQVEIVAPGYQPLDVDVRITPGEKVTYQGDLLPEQPGQPFAEPPQP